MHGMFCGHERVDDGACVAPFEPTLGTHRPFALAMCARVHQGNAITSANKKQRMFKNAYAVVGDAVKQQDPGTVWPRGSDFPAAKQNSIRSANVKRFLVNTDLRKGSIGLLDQVRRKDAPDGMQEGRSDEPAGNDRGQHRKKQQNDEDSHDSPGHGPLLDVRKPNRFRSANTARNVLRLRCPVVRFRSAELVS